jgi:hypothetical protein
MARDGKPRPAPRPTSITEVARRYHAAALALAQTWGLSVPEVLTQHREAVTAVFIECGRCDLRVPAGVTLPPLAEAPVASTHGQGEETSADAPVVRPPVAQPANGHASPTTIPADGDLPCRGQEIALLKPAALHMLIAKTAALVQNHQDDWIPLLHALQAERARRVAQGQRPKPSAVGGKGHGGEPGLDVGR